MLLSLVGRYVLNKNCYGRWFAGGEDIRESASEPGKLRFFFRRRSRVEISCLPACACACVCDVDQVRISHSVFFSVAAGCEFSATWCVVIRMEKGRKFEPRPPAALAHCRSSKQLRREGERESWVCDRQLFRLGT